MFNNRKLIAGTGLLAKILFAGKNVPIRKRSLTNFVALAVQENSVQADQCDADMAGGSNFGLLLLLLFGLLMGAASPAIACKDFGGVIDGDVIGAPPSGQVQIDSNCTIRNFPASNPLTTNFSFFQPGNSKQKYLVVFDNVVHTGQMSCNSTHEHKIWFTNGSSTAIQDGCQNLLIPVEKIDKQSLATTAAIGVPFTYTLTIPVLFDPATGGVINNAGSVNDLHGITITDDLNAMGAALSLVGTPSVTYLASGAAVPHTFSNVGGVLTFSAFPIVNAGEQIVIDITVVLDDIPSNSPGTQFFNTAKWEFGRLIDNKFYDPLPGEWGITPSITIVEPNLIVTKTSPDTALNLGVPATFSIDVQNTGGSDAWSVTILDQLPDEPTAGMCDFDPTSGLGVSAQIFAADGVTDVSGLLVPAIDYTVTYNVASCQLSLTMLTPKAVIGPTQRLIIGYQSQLDADSTADGLLLSNVAGAIEWLSSDGNSPPHIHSRTLSDGTPAVADHEDNYTITTALSGYFFQKTVENLTSGVNPATTAAPGDRLRYKLRVFNVDQAINNLRISDPLDPTLFDTGSFSMVSLPAGTLFSFDPGSGQLTISGNPPPLDLNVGNELVIEFEINLKSGLTNNTPVPNQASFTANGPLLADSDDPFVNGIAAPGDPADPTIVIIHAPGPLSKANTKPSATIGEQFKYTITLPATTVDTPLYDVRILDDLIPSAADMRFISANVVSGGSWTLSNTGTDTSPVIEDSITGIDIPANGQAVIEITVELLNTANNDDGIPFINTATYTYNRINGDPGTQTTGSSGVTTNMTIVESDLAVTKVGTVITAGPVSGGSIIEYVISMTNGGNATAYDVNVVDNLPAELALGSFVPTATIGGSDVVGFNPDPAGAPAGPLIWGQGNGDGSLDVPVGATLILTYQAQVQTSTATTFNNEVWIDWTSLDNASAGERTGAGCPTITIPHDDYCATAISTPIDIIDNNSLDKAVIADSWVSDGSTAVDKTLRIGDTATYQLILNLGEGSTNNVTVSDILPPGMAFASLVSITPASGSGSFVYALASQPAAGATGTLLWDFGTITNTPSGDGTPVDALVIEYIATVLPDAGITQTPSTTLTNTATLAYVDSTGVAVVDPARLQASDTLTLLQPVMATVSKTGNGSANDVGDPLNVDVANDIMQFQLQTCNESIPLAPSILAAPAYSVLLTDVLATQLDETSLTVPVVTANGNTLTAGSDYIYTAPAGPGGSVTIQLITAVDPGQCIIVDYNIGFHTNILPTQTWNNSVTVDEYWSLPQTLLPGSGQLYSPLGPAQFFMTNIVGIAPLSKIVSSPLSGEITIGEEAIYTITVPANTTFNAVLNDVLVTDPLHDSLEYIGATAVDGAGNVVTLIDTSTGQNVSLGITQIPANEQVFITLRTRLANNVAADAGVSFTNTATYTSPNLPDPVSATSAALTIVEPELAINKTVNPAVAPMPGDILTYSLTFTASSGANFSDAFDLSITDTLSAGLAYVPNSSTVDGGNTISNPVVSGQTLTWELAASDIDVIEGTTVTVTYQVSVLAAVQPGQILSNTASVQWTSLDGVVADERTGNGQPDVNSLDNYFTAPVTTTLTTQSGALLKEITQATASIGEQFSYRITVPALVQPTSLSDVRILDNLNISTLDTVDMSFVSVTKISAGGSWLPGNTSGDLKNLVIEDTTGVGIDIPAGQQAIIEITVVLNDSASNVSGLVFNNTADYTHGVTQIPGLPDTSVNMTIVGPDSLILDKTGPATMRVGTPETFTLNLRNTGTGPAWNLTITDNLPNPVPGGMCDAAPTAITVQKILADGTPVLPVLDPNTDYISSFTAAPVCSLTITMKSSAAVIDENESFIVTYLASLDADSVGGSALTNVAAATEWFSGDTAGASDQIRTFTGILTDGTVGTDDEQDAHNLSVESPVMIFQKTVVNASTNQDPGADALPGHTLRYTLYVENDSSVPLSGFSLLDELDALNATAMFVPGSLKIISFPAGADISNTDPNGGVNGTGLLDVRDLNIEAKGGADTVEVVFEMTLLPVINSTTLVLNQAQIISFGAVLADSDDPNVNGVDDPAIGGDEDPTQTRITSAPLFVTQKISQDITGDPAVLEPGDVLRYTLTVKNIGNENTINTLLSDQIPSNTSYVAGTTTLNTMVVVDPAVGVSALTAGMFINAPENTTVGFMRADSNVAANNVAIITFDVVINASVVDGTVISNQGFVSGLGAGSGVFPLQPSDDPDTALVDDPTLDVVGSAPVVDVLKTVAIEDDVNGDGIVNPGDTLRYTITASNIGTLPATAVVLTDAVPANTTYVADSVLLNSIPVAQPDGGLSPLVSGIDISSSDLTPPLPTAGNGTLSAGASAVISFDVLVNAAVPDETIISNQGFVNSNELPEEPSDADGNDANGNQTTDIVVGNVQQLAITKQVLVIGGGEAQAGGQLEYVVRVTNIGGIAATSVVITDALDPNVMIYVDGSGLLNGLPVGVVPGSTITADYSSIYGDLAVGDVAELRFRVSLNGTLNIGTNVSNTGEVNWDSPNSPLTADVVIGIGGAPGSANLNGQLWHDTNFDNVADSNEALLQGWRVELYRNNVLLANAQTDANGAFQFSGVVPVLVVSDGLYEIRFVAPGATASTATLGVASSAFTNAPHRITGIVAATGSSVQDLNLPRQPNGIVYDSILRTAVAGVQLHLVNQTRSNQVVPTKCFDDPVQQNQVTLAEGYYKFDLNFSDSNICAEGDEYEIQIQPPANGFVGTTSVIIPPVVPVTGPALDVPKCPNTSVDKIPATTLHCENNVSAVQPDPSIVSGEAGSEYNLKFIFSDLPPGTPFTDQIFNNHIPVDPELEAAVAISKVAGKLNVTRSDLVPYTITINNTLPVPLQALNVVDNFPAGFKYVSGSARIDGVEVEPLVNGRQLTWSNVDIAVAEKRVIKLLLIVGSGVGEGEYVNTAQVINSQTNEAFSGIASATVRVIPDPTFDCTDIVGKVFEDKNNNAYQDQGETGIAGVQVATARGLRVTTDTHGRFHITCAIVPGEVRGSNFIMKLDDRTLPSGYRVTTENPRVQRATRGKMLKFNFGATIHRVVRLDLADGVFEKGSTKLRPQWLSRINMLIMELQKDASILRLSYLGENETEDEAEDRLDAIEELISDRWQELDCCYKLTIETEVFWRKGRPSDRRVFE